MLRFLTLAKVHSVEETLFHYRSKDRSYQYPPDYPGSKFQQMLYLIRHQLSVTMHIFEIINNSSFLMIEKNILRIYAALVFVNQ